MLVVAMLKANRMSWMIQKATELGVKAIYPVITHYSVIKVDTEKASTYLNRWKSIALQSLKQCRGNFLPIIHSPDSLERTLKKVSCAKAKIVLWEQEKKRSLFSAWNEQGNDIPVSIIAGPEGGFSREEITACRDAGFSSATMGKRTLRSETAAIGAVAAITAIMTFGLEKEH
jgi:16S rRNA (uracil1498-N3)-methyltransferase